MRKLLIAPIAVLVVLLAACTGGSVYERVPPNVQVWESDIERWAQEHDVPREIVIATISLESCGRPDSRSSAGAAGLFQVMPFHFDEGEDPLDVETNAKRGMSYLAYCHRQAGGDRRRVAVCYNGGASYTTSPIEEWPRSTVSYSLAFQAFVDDLVDGTDHYLGQWMQERGQYCTELAEDDES